MSQMNPKNVWYVTNESQKTSDMSQMNPKNVWYVTNESQKTSDMSQMNPKNVSIILQSQFNYHTLPVTPFKETDYSPQTPTYPYIFAIWWCLPDIDYLIKTKFITLNSKKYKILENWV